MILVIIFVWLHKYYDIYNTILFFFGMANCRERLAKLASLVGSLAGKVQLCSVKFSILLNVKTKKFQSGNQNQMGFWSFDTYVRTTKPFQLHM